MKCHFHPRTKATAACSTCGLGLCRQCQIEDSGLVYCENCYASGDTGDGSAGETDDREAAESEDLIDLELMDMLDTDDDDGLF